MDTLVAYAPVIGLLFFFIVFVGLAVQMLRPSQAKKVQAFANIPFEEDKNV